MSTGLPRRTVSYDSQTIDASRWDRFSPRDGDIFICTPPKCGTTWMQAICALLIFGRPDHDVRPGVVSPWLDARHLPLDEMLSMLEAQTHRRFIKTHTPLDGIPYFPQCTYLAVYRDPRDAHFSMRNHATNQISGRHVDRATKDVGEGFRRWARKPYVEGDRDNFSLVAHVHHYETYRRFMDLPNIDMFHFGDMKRDLSGTMARIAHIFGVSLPAAVMAGLVQAATFENMKKNADQFVPGAGQGRWKNEGRFFHKGGNDQWRGSLTEEDLAIYRDRMRDLLSEEDIAWLENGARG
jgi:aryl sulfotransferase